MNKFLILKKSYMIIWKFIQMLLIKRKRNSLILLNPMYFFRIKYIGLTFVAFCKGQRAKIQNDKLPFKRHLPFFPYNYNKSFLGLTEICYEVLRVNPIQPRSTSSLVIRGIIRSNVNVEPSRSINSILILSKYSGLSPAAKTIARFACSPRSR